MIEYFQLNIENLRTVFFRAVGSTSWKQAKSVAKRKIIERQSEATSTNLQSTIFNIKFATPQLRGCFYRL